ncbi:hypothetical protein QQS21_000742 [Conoideocrella luteorostrata]|uniref:Uncharacterized protein n=1 Tax=Conoideocrella luteorostrata TaxID=1105319 RepID=A0AAJ0CYH9_9HYPO|nr:hypothetical protein QQS21_000742 [Conoideocrella luteorostrata]
MATRSSNITLNPTRRRVLAAPIILWAVILTPSLLGASIIAPLVNQWHEKSLYQFKGKSVPLKNEFYGIQMLDRICADIAAVFGLLQFHEESHYYWHSLDFLAQYGAVYGILMLESSKKGYRSRLLLRTIAVITLSQCTNSGLLLPIYFYFLHTSSNLKSLKHESASLEQNSASALAVLPTVALAFYAPHFGSFLDPDFAARHWWNWLWQPFPVWGTILFFVFSGLFTMLPKLQGVLPAFLAKRIKLHSRLKATRLTAVYIGMINIGTYWCVLGVSGHSWWDIYVPKHFLQPAKNPQAALGTIMQFDYIAIFGSAITWLVYQFVELKAAGLLRMSWARILLVGFGVAVVFGPGALCWVGWMAREEVLASSRAWQGERSKTK